MAIRFAHTGLVARDPERLAEFYVDVLGGVARERRLEMQGPWLDHATGLTAARATGLHVALPGHERVGPTLEILRYDGNAGVPAERAVDHPGLGHLAFEVDDIDAVLAQVVGAGGRTIGEPADVIISGRGTLRVVFARDPEGNILELQTWS